MRVAIGVLIATFLLSTVASARWYGSRLTHIVLYSHGTPEVPQGRMFTIFNPFRDRTSEHTAERLIRDLKSDQCEHVVRGLDIAGEYDPRICTVMRHASGYSLVWRADEESAKELVYNVPDQRARLWIGFRRDESGFGVSSVTVIR
jgi:hypothetical protein